MSATKQQCKDTMSRVCSQGKCQVQHGLEGWPSRLCKYRQIPVFRLLVSLLTADQHNMVFRTEQPFLQDSISPRKGKYSITMLKDAVSIIPVPVHV